MKDDAIANLNQALVYLAGASEHLAEVPEEIFPRGSFCANLALMKAEDAEVYINKMINALEDSK